MLTFSGAATARTAGCVILGVCMRCYLDHQTRWPLGSGSYSAVCVNTLRPADRCVCVCQAVHTCLI